MTRLPLCLMEFVLLYCYVGKLHNIIFCTVHGASRDSGAPVMAMSHAQLSTLTPKSNILPDDFQNKEASLYEKGDL